MGRTIQSLAEPGFPAESYEVIGVVADTRYADLRQTPPPIAYAPELQNPQFGPGMAVVVRASIPAAQAMSAVRRIISDGYAAATMDQVELRTMVRERFLRERLLAWVSGFFGILAVALATIGFYGVVSHMAARRQNEIGIRIALGAGRRDVVGLLLRNVAALFAIGVPLGLLGSLALARGVSTLLYDIQPGDPLALGLAAAALTITGVVATLIPSARASRLDPGKCLRAD